MTISEISEIFLISLSLGMTCFSFIPNPVHTGSGFFKLSYTVSLGALLLALLLRVLFLPISTELMVFYGITSFALISQRMSMKEEKNIMSKALYALAMIALVYLIFMLSNKAMISFFYLISSALFLGSIIFAMILGHWYLVVPKLSEQPLKVCHYFMWPVMFIKIGITLVFLMQNYEFFTSGTELGGGYIFNWIMLTMRIGWGYLVIGIMSYFSWRLVKMRSIQSATGVLYAMTFFILIGELVSQFMFLKHGMFL